MIPLVGGDMCQADDWLARDLDSAVSAMTPKAARFMPHHHRIRCVRLCILLLDHCICSLPRFDHSLADYWPILVIIDHFVCLFLCVCAPLWRKQIRYSTELSLGAVQLPVTE